MIKTGIQVPSLRFDLIEKLSQKGNAWLSISIEMIKF